METVVVKKSELLDKLRTNRQTHREVFLKAQEGYRTEVIKQLEEMLANAREGKRIITAVHLIAPMDQTRDYDRAIKMLEMSVEEEIELTEQDFMCFVLDEWHWRQQWAMANATYTTVPGVEGGITHTPIPGSAGEI